MSLLGDITTQLLNPLLPAATKTVLTNAQNSLLAYNAELNKLNGKFKAAINYAEPADGYGNNAPLVDPSVQALINALTSARSSIATLNSQNASLQTQLTDAQAQVAQLNTDKASLTAQLNTAQGQVTQLTGDKQTLQTAVASAQQDTAVAQAETLAANNTLATQRTQLIALQGSIDKLNGDKFTLQGQLADMQLQYNLATQGSDNLAQQLQTAQAGWDSAKASNATMAQQLVAATEATVTANDRLTVMTANYTTTLQQRDSTLSLLSDTQAASATKDSKITQQAALMAQAAEQLSSVQAQLLETQDDHAQAEAQVQSYTEENSRMTAEITRLKAQLEGADMSPAREVLQQIIASAEGNATVFNLAKAQEIARSLGGDPAAVKALNVRRRGGLHAVLLYLLALMFEALNNEEAAKADE